MMPLKVSARGIAVMSSRLGSIGLVIVGTLFLLNNLDVLKFSQISGVLRTWWPLILIAVGVAGLVGKHK